MQAEKHTSHWPSLLLMIVCLTGAVVLLSLAGLMVLAAAMMLFDQDFATLTSALTLAAGLTLLAALLAPGIYYASRRMNGPGPAGGAFEPRRWRWAGFGLLLAWPASVAAGHWAANNVEWGWLVLPLANVVASGTPIAFLTAIGIRQIKTGPGWQSWGVFGLGLTAGPLVMMVAEILLIGFLFVLILLFIGLTPGMAETAIQLSDQLTSISNEEEILRLLLPILTDPKTLALVLFGVAVCVPLIEELLKPLGVWLFAGYIRSPRQGFALGLLSGAAYALFETLGASSQAGADWATLVMARSGTSLLHILTTGLTSWALVSAWRERKRLRLAAVYTLSVSLHGLWNSMNILNALGMALKDSAGAPEWVRQISAPSVAVLGVEAGLMLILLGAANYLARQGQAPEPDPEAAKTAV